MATSEGYENSSGRVSGHTPLLEKDNTKVDWNNYSLLMFAHLQQKRGAFKVFMTPPPPTGTDKEMREIEHLNNWCYSVLIESCRGNATAMMQAQALFDIRGSDTWAQTYWKSLESRFTRERISQVQEQLIILGKFSKEPSETFKDMVDRFKKLIADVRAIDPLQVPSETNLMAVLKKAVEPIENLWVHLEFDEKMDLEKMFEIITRWRGAGANLANFKSVSELGSLANFVYERSKPKGDFKKFRKDKEVKKFIEQRRCLVCEKKGHLVKDCNDPRKEEWIRNRQNRDDRNNNSERRGRSRDRNPRERSRERSASRDRGHRGSSGDRDRRGHSRERSRDRDGSADRSNFNKSRKSNKAWMSESGDQIDSDGDSNMLYEELNGERVDAAFHADVAFDLACVDSGCNKLVLQQRPEMREASYVPSVNRFLRTASAGTQLAIVGMGLLDNQNGSVTEYKYCPDASANLIPTLAITKTGAHIHIFFDRPTRTEVCFIECAYLDLQKQIQCLGINGLFWITLDQMYDIILRDGFTTAEYDDAFARNNRRSQDSFLSSSSDSSDYCHAVSEDESSAHEHSGSVELETEEDYRPHFGELREFHKSMYAAQVAVRNPRPAQELRERNSMVYFSGQAHLPLAGSLKGFLERRATETRRPRSAVSPVSHELKYEYDKRYRLDHGKSV